ncbi:unknown [Prevotella sp. CAG:924]|nr:unknown [Prevotella sp. CAG:924]
MTEQECLPFPSGSHFNISNLYPLKSKTVTIRKA